MDLSFGIGNALDQLPKDLLVLRKNQKQYNLIQLIPFLQQRILPLNN